MNALQNHLTTLGACPEAIEWVGAYSSLQDAWDACERADWLLWYAARRGVDRKLLVRAACACARTALLHIPPGEDRPRIAIEMAERWASGAPAATLKDLRAAADAANAAADAAYAYAYAAYAAADAAYAYAAAYAANAAAYAANAAADAAYAYAYAAYAAADATYAAYAAAYAAAAYAANAAAATYAAAHRTMCALVRSLIPCPEAP